MIATDIDHRQTTQRRGYYWVAVGLVFLGALLNLGYLWGNCPLDLSEDETHYWEWSRHLDWGYYSKGPGIAWIMRGMTELGRLAGLEVSMPLLRSAAVGFSVVSGLMGLALAMRIFRDGRAALLTTLFSAAAPVFVVGAMLLTIDSPMYLCWAVATYALWRRIEASEEGPAEQRGAAGTGWLYLAGLFVGLGILCKPVLAALPLCAAVAAWLSPAVRRALATRHSAGALVLALLLQAPIIVWNAGHGWMTFRHIGAQGGFGQPAKVQTLTQTLLGPPARLGSYLGGQAGILGGVLFILLIAALVPAWQAVRRARNEAGPERPFDETRRTTGLAFLLAMALPLWLFYAVLSLWTNTEPNWPAASYFAFMVLLGGVAAGYWADRTAREHKAWKRWTCGAVVWGLLLATLAQHTEWFYPMANRRAQDNLKSPWHPKRWDLSLRMRGLAARGGEVGAAAAAWEKESGQAPLIATTRYDTSSSLAFYLPGRPFVHCLMSATGGRKSQYDVWAGLNEKREGKLVHEGRNVLLVGPVDEEVLAGVIRPAFAEVEAAVTLPVYAQGIKLREVTVRRCRGFRGLAEREGGSY